MNKFCVGQKVIDVFGDRALRTVVKTFESGQIELDNGVITYGDRVQVQESYIDPTNYFYHHSRYADGMERACDGFMEYMFAIEEMESLTSYPGESAFLIKARSMCQTLIDAASAKIEKGLAIQRTADYNCAQWGGVTLDHHFPFLNPEDVSSY